MERLADGVEHRIARMGARLGFAPVESDREAGRSTCGAADFRRDHTGLEPGGEFRGRDRPEANALAAAADGGKERCDAGGHEHELRAPWWLLEGLQEGIGGILVQDVGGVEDDEAALSAVSLKLEGADQGMRLVDGDDPGRTLWVGADQDQVGVSTGCHEATRPARPARALPALTVHILRKPQRKGRFSYAFRAFEQVGVMQPILVGCAREPLLDQAVADERECGLHAPPLPCRPMTALDDWNAAASKHPRPRFLEEVLAAGARHGGGPVCVHRTPLLLDERAVRVWQRVLPPMHRLLWKLRIALLADLSRGPESLAARIGIPADAIAWASIDPGFGLVAPLARLDAYVVDGVPRFLELNAESPAGMGYASALAPVFAADPAAPSVGPLGFVDPAPAVVSTVRAVFAEWNGAPVARFNVAIVDDAGVATAPEFDLLARHFRAAGLPTIIAAPADLRFDGDRLWAGDVAIDVVFRRILVCDIRATPVACAALLAAYRARRVCMVNSLRTALLHNKGIFALLHDPAFPLTEGERAFVGRHIPLTLRLDDAARERVRGDPERWVLKPAEAHGGRGVILGWRVGREAWERAVDGAEGCVVQARVQAPIAGFLDARDGRIHPRVVDLGPFLARGRFAGFLCRVAEGELANVSAGGATQVPVFSVARRV